MKLKFSRKDDNSSVSILVEGSEELEFNYIEMVKRIYLDRKIEPAVIEGDFSVDEKKSIDDLISEISEGVESLFSEVEEEQTESDTIE